MLRLIAYFLMKKVYLYAGVALLFVGMFLGHIIATIIFFGILTAASIIFLVESSLSVKRFCGKYGMLIDFVLFVLSALAVAKLGVTVAGGLGVASLIFTVYRVTFLSPWYEKLEVTTRSVWSYICQGFNSVVDGVKSLFVKSEKSVA